MASFSATAPELIRNGSINGTLTQVSDTEGSCIRSEYQSVLPLQPEHQQMIRLRGPDVREPAARRRPDPAEVGKIVQVVGRIGTSVIWALERVVHIPPE